MDSTALFTAALAFGGAGKALPGLGPFWAQANVAQAVNNTASKARDKSIGSSVRLIDD
jgi:hypothetical protein